MSTRKKVTPHPSHQRITNVPGRVRADGTIIRPHVRRSKTLPPPYVAPQDPMGMGAGEYGPMFNPGDGGPEGW